MITYRKSSYSGGSGGDCVEWALLGDTVRVRDSKAPDGPTIDMIPAEWVDLSVAAATGRPHPWVVPTADGVDLIRAGTRLCFTASEWSAFAAGARAGECLVAA